MKYLSCLNVCVTTFIALVIAPQNMARAQDAFSLSVKEATKVVNATDFRFRVLHIYPKDKTPTPYAKASLMSLVEDVRQYYGRKLEKTFVLADSAVAEHNLTVSRDDLYSGAQLSKSPRILSTGIDSGTVNLLRYIVENVIPAYYQEESDDGNDFIVLLDGVDDSVFIGTEGVALITDGALAIGAMGSVVLAHEVGHALGLYHTPSSADCLKRNFGVAIERPLSDHALMQPALSMPGIWDSLRGKDLESYSFLEFEVALLTKDNYPAGPENATRCLNLVSHQHPTKYLTETFDEASVASSFDRAVIAGALSVFILLEAPLR